MGSHRNKRTGARKLFEQGSAPLAGTRHRVGQEAVMRRALVTRLLDRFFAAKYALVTTPFFDAEAVFLAGPGLVEPHDFLRFVEPETGVTAVLRPDITPQIARLTASRFRKAELPLRFAYEGSVFRRGRGRARKRREIAQVGVEHIGDSSFAADLEVLKLAIEACAAAGVRDMRVELSHAVIGHALVGESASAELVAALARRDDAAIAALLPGRDARSKGHLARLRAAVALGSDARAIVDAAKLFSGARERAAIEQIERAFRTISRMRNARASVGVDFCEVRDLGYYTGLRFSIYAHGPGEALGGGGRYDALLAAHGLNAAAVGFGLDLDNVAWAQNPGAER